MTFGLGWHPYFPLVEQASLHLACRTLCLLDPAGFPGMPQKIDDSSILDLRSLDGTVEIELAGPSIALTCGCQGRAIRMNVIAARYLVVHVAGDARAGAAMRHSRRLAD